MFFPINSQSVSLDVFVGDDSFKPVLGLLAATFPPLFFSLAGPFADIAIGPLTDLPSLTTPYTPMGVKEIGGGRYRVHLPPSVFAKAGKGHLRGEASGKHVLADPIEVGVFAPASRWSN